MAVTVNKPSTWAHYVALLKKDLSQELHTKDMVTSMGLYALLVLVVYGASLAQAGSDLDIQQMSGGLLWAVILFTSLLGLNRSFSYEKEQGCLDGMLLVPMDRSVIFLAKATANLLFLAVVEVVCVPLFFFFFLSQVGAASSWPMIIIPLIAGTIGIAGVGTILSTITINTRGKDVMLAVMFIPLLFPLLWSCVSATTCALCAPDGWMSTFITSLTLAGAYDVVMILISWVLYDFVISA